MSGNWNDNLAILLWLMSSASQNPMWYLSQSQQLQIQMPLTMKMTPENLESGKVELANQGVYAQFIDH